MAGEPTVIVKDQAGADALIPPKVPCHLRIEDMEGPIDLTWIPDRETDLGLPGHYLRDRHILSVTVSGGEQPVHPQWVRVIRDQCKTAGVPFTFESWGEWQDGSDQNFASDVVLLDGRHGPLARDMPWFSTQPINVDKWNSLKPTMVARVGRERSGRTLDGAIHAGGNEG